MTDNFYFYKIGVIKFTDSNIRRTTLKDQHTKIKGYRDLSQEEIDLMNLIKDTANLVETALYQIQQHIIEQNKRAFSITNNEDEQQRIFQAEAYEWYVDAKKELQTGFMKLVRSVAQPTTF